MPDARSWIPGPILDQGMTSQCVAYTGVQWLQTQPIVNSENIPDPRSLYHECQQIDEWEGEEPDVQGTSVRALMKIFRLKGYVDRYVWARSAEDVKKFVLSEAPMPFGTNWTDEMFFPDENGLIIPNGKVEGGHAYLCVGYSNITHQFEFVNSWGDTWGAGGKFYMRYKDVEKLLRQQGEACAALELMP